MQSLRRTSTGRELGATNWAFIITLIIALVFIWLWFQETDKIDKAMADKKAADEAVEKMNAEGVKLADALSEVSEAVGWKSKSFSLQHIRRNEPTFPYTDAAAVKATTHRSKASFIAVVHPGLKVDKDLCAHMSSGLCLSIAYTQSEGS